MESLYLVKKIVQLVEWNVYPYLDNIPEVKYTLIDSSKEIYPIKMFPNLIEAVKWINDDKKLFIKENQDKYNIIHNNTHIDIDKMVQNVPSSKDMDREYHYFHNTQLNKDYKYMPSDTCYLSMRTKEPLDEYGFFKKDGKFKGQECSYYVEESFIDTNTLFGGELKHCPLRAYIEVA